jgi:hypothetical protein
METTAFIVVLRQDGSYYATVDLSTAIEVERDATRYEIKRGCSDILDVINQSDTAKMTAEMVIQAITPLQPETISGSIREALDERGIL